MGAEQLRQHYHQSRMNYSGKPFREAASSKRLFNPFARGNDATSRRYVGVSGVGEDFEIGLDASNVTPGCVDSPEAM